MFYTDIHTVCSQTGFIILFRDNIDIFQDTIGYLPTINAPANDMSTINEILSQSLQIKQSLELEKIFVCLTKQYIIKLLKCYEKTINSKM